MWRLLCIFVLIGIVVYDNSSAVQSVEEETPSIYYYSMKEHAFIIEQANGENKRHLTDFVIEDNEYISGSGWSPSGEWFTWKKNNISEQLFIINRDGIFQDFSSTIANISQTVWSPVDDLLAVQSLTPNGLQITLLDIDQKAFLFQEEFQSESMSMAWSPDGSFMYLFNKGWNTETSSIIIIDKHGGIISHSLCGTVTCNHPGWINDTTISFLKSSTELIIEDVQSQTIMTSFGLGFEPTYIDWAWDDYGLIYQYQNITKSYALYILSLRTGIKLKLVNENVTLYGADGWWESTTDQYIFKPLSAWNNEHARYAFIGNGILYYFDIGSVNPTKISSNDNNVKGFVWLHNNTIIYFTDKQMYLYIIDLSEQILLVDNDIDSTYTYPTIHNQNLIYTDYRLVHIVDLSTSNETILRLITDNYGKSDIVGANFVMWHPNKDWLWLASEVGGVINVSDSEGALQRELTQCSNLNKACVGWLP